MLRQNLQRDGESLVVDTDLLQFDVATRRLGILTIPDHTLHVGGDARIGNVHIANTALSSVGADLILNPAVGQNVVVSSGTVDSIAFFGGGLELQGSSNLAFDGSSLSITGSLSVDDITLDGNTISSTNGLVIETGNNGDIDITPHGSGSVNITNPELVGLTPDRVLISNTSGNLSQSADLQFDSLTSTLLLTGHAGVTTLSASSNIEVGSSLRLTTSQIEVVSNNTDLTISTTGNSMVVFDRDLGIVIPGGPTSARPVTPSAGTIRFNDDDLVVEVWDGSDWRPVGPSFSFIDSQIITGDNTTLTFDLDHETVANGIVVSINGVLQVPGASYSVNVDEITFAEAPLSTDIVEVRFLSLLTSLVATLENNAVVDGGEF